MQRLESKPTAWPCANQPEEKLTAPGSCKWLLPCVKKLPWWIRQFGSVLLGIDCWMDLCSKGAMLAVASLMESYVFIQSILRPGGNKKHKYLLLIWHNSRKIPSHYPVFDIHHSDRLRIATQIRVGESDSLLVPFPLDVLEVVFFNIPWNADCPFFEYCVILKVNTSLTRVEKRLANYFYQIPHPLTVPPLPWRFTPLPRDTYPWFIFGRIFKNDGIVVFFKVFLFSPWDISANKNKIKFKISYKS